jgi:hypothetical protein
MRRTVLAFAVAALTLAAVPASQAAPIAPPVAGVAADHGNLTQVRWGWHGGWHGGWHRGWGWHGGWGWHRHWRHCWWGPYHRWYCRWW